AKIAQASGIKNSKTAWTLAEFKEAYLASLKYKGPSFIVAKVPPVYDHWEPKTGSFIDTQRSKYRFADYLRKTENIDILAQHH
ncbi:MAG: hypothetical protein HY680_08445, partial [Chloroflexi bacterium]|nr:hypothetical protein [Chloroflexota bacterium]